MNPKAIDMRGRQSKYRAVRTEGPGPKGTWRFYHSRKEAKFAEALHVAWLNGSVTEWQPQVPYHLHVHGKPLGKYVMDFVVFYADPTREAEYFDIKGMDTPLSKWKRKHCELEYGIKIELR